MVVSKSIPLRLDDELLARLDALAGLLTKRAAGVKVTRSAAMRNALERGIQELETELDAAARRPKPKPKPKK